MSHFGLGNYGHYRGEDLSEQLEHERWNQQQRFEHMKRNLIDIIGEAAYQEWSRTNFPEGRAPSWSAACMLIGNELDRYECSCTPVHDPCSGCKLRAEAKKRMLAYSNFGTEED